MRLGSGLSSCLKGKRQDLTHLLLEKVKLQENLAVTICEADVYSELLTRLPDHAIHLRKFQSEAKSYTINLMGKINALEKVLSVMN